jgi:uncharacterized protein (TIGR02444 family)
MSLRFPDSEFWDFSVTLYAEPGVAPACLALQERHGADVNALMLCLWLAASGRGPVAPARLEAAFAAAEAWHAEVVRALRAVRRRLKTPVGAADPELAQALRARIQKIEIDAEHIEQLTLAAGLAAAPAQPGLGADLRADHAAQHLAVYFRRLGARPGAADLDALAAVAGAAIALPDAAIRAHLSRALA